MLIIVEHLFADSSLSDITDLCNIESDLHGLISTSMQIWSHCIAWFKSLCRINIDICSSIQISNMILHCVAAAQQHKLNKKSAQILLLKLEMYSSKNKCKVYKELSQLFHRTSHARKLRCERYT